MTGAPKILQRPSPHHRNRRGQPITLVVVHADASHDAGATLDYIATPKLAKPVSYHYLVGRTGAVYQAVPAERAAYHAGVSEHPGCTVRGSVNDASVGVCLSNAQDGEPFTEVALHAAARLVAYLATLHPGLRDADHPSGVRLTTHSACARPVGRKHDPGPRFPWDRFCALVRAEL